MTMFPAHRQNLFKKDRYGGYGGGCGGGGGGTDQNHHYLEGGYDHQCFITEACLGSDLMAEDESRTESGNNNEAGSSSNRMDDEKDDRGWLQLSIGGHLTTSQEDKPDRTAATSGDRGRLIELDLLPGSSSTGGSSQELLMRPLSIAPGPPLIFHVPDFRAPFSAVTNFTSATIPPFFFQQRGGTSTSPATFPHPQESCSTNYRAFRPIPRSITPAPPPPSPSLSTFGPPPPSRIGASYFPRPFQVHGGTVDVAGPSFDFRVVNPPRRPHSGVWFMLQASQTQAKEPFLQQLPKSYLRIKDGGMTVRLLIKYLVKKLSLDSESEQVEIRCRGQQLMPLLTLQHVRDNVWNSSTGSDDATVTLFPHSSVTSSTADHLMVLHYGRIA